MTQDCGAPFPTGAFFHLDNQPLCEAHYGRRSGNVCASCNEVLQGTCVTFRKLKYHPKHFTCTLCKKPLPTESFMEKDEKPYCKPCHVKLFG